MAAISTMEFAKRVAQKLGTNIDTALDIIDCIMMEAKLDIKTRNFAFLPDIGKFFLFKSHMPNYKHNIVRFNPSRSFREWLKEKARGEEHATVA